MAILNRYNVRMQMRRKVYVDAQNIQHAKDLAVQDVIDMDDAEKASAQSAEMVWENTGVSAQGNIQLDGFEVVVRFRRNIILDAENNQDARYWAEQDQGSWYDTESGSMQLQQVTFMKESTGVT